MISHNPSVMSRQMFGLFSSGKKEKGDLRDVNSDVAKLFFDTFSRRVGRVEESLQSVSGEIEKLKASVDRGQVSDLVLLDRLRQAEELVRKSLVSIRESVEKISVTDVSVAPATSLDEKPSLAERQEVSPILGVPVFPSPVFSPIGEVGSIKSITTPTELQVLTMLANEGPKSAPEIGRAVGRSREHTARLMKKLYQEGYIRRDQARIPFRYSLVEKVKQSFKKTEVKDGAKEPISVPQT